MNHPKFVLYTTLCLTILFLFVKSTKVNVTLIDANSTRSTEDSNLLCIEPNHREICSGNGVCMNGTCHCWGLDHEIDPFFKYSGKYCEECPYCKGQRCGKFMPCVQCVLNDKTRNCSLKCSSVNYSVVGVLKIEDGGDKLCEREDENGCVFLFKYIYNNRNALELFIEKGKTCLDGRKCNLCMYKEIPKI